MHDNGRVVFRADADRKIGAGHLVRSSALAATFRNLGWQTELVTQRNSEPYLPVVKSAFDKLCLVSNDDEAAVNILHDVDSRSKKIAVIDGYTIPIGLETRIKRHMPVMAIDDRPVRCHDVDFLLDPTPGRSVSQYNGLVPKGCDVIVGPHYALLRPDFHKPREPRVASDPRRHSFVLVMFGGSDQDELYETSLRVLMRMEYSSKLHIVCGSKLKKKLKDFAPHLSVTVNASGSEIADLLDRCSFSIGASGSASWERCACAVPSIVTSIAENQNDIARGLQEAGAAYFVPVDSFETELVGALEQMTESSSQYSVMSKAALGLCDGQGALRIAEKLTAACN